MVGGAKAPSYIYDIIKKIKVMNAPSQEIFEEMNSIATLIWKQYDNRYGYVTEKLNYINSFGNVADNAMVFYRMFDNQNQEIFRANATPKVLNYIDSNK